MSGWLSVCVYVCLSFYRPSAGRSVARSVCLPNLQLGLSLLVGLALPRWVAANSSSIDNGILCISNLCVCLSVFLSNLRHVDIRKPRKMCALGLSLLVFWRCSAAVSREKVSVFRLG